MADKLILNAGVNGLNSFEKLNSELKKIKSGSTGALTTLSKKTSESISKIKLLGSTITPIKSKLTSLGQSQPFTLIKSKLESLKGGFDVLKQKVGGLKGVFGGLKGYIMGAIAGVRTVSFQKVVKPRSTMMIQKGCFRTVSFQKVVKHEIENQLAQVCFRTVSFQKVVKPRIISILCKKGFRTVSFQKVVKQQRIL